MPSNEWARILERYFKHAKWIHSKRTGKIKNVFKHDSHLSLRLNTQTKQSINKNQFPSQKISTFTAKYLIWNIYASIPGLLGGEGHVLICWYLTSDSEFQITYWKSPRKVKNESLLIFICAEKVTPPPTSSFTPLRRRKFKEREKKEVF